jgi:hypothetical protein
MYFENRPKSGIAKTKAEESNRKVKFFCFLTCTLVFFISLDYNENIINSRRIKIMKSLFEERGSTYTELNEYLIPNFILSESIDII